MNHVRLSPANTESRAVEINDGDIIQLGVDFQGGREEIYRSVKMKFEVNRSKKASRLSFNINQFQNLRALIQPPLPSTSNIHVNNTTTTDTSANISNDDQEASSPSASSSSSSEPVAVATVSRTLSTPTAVTTMSVTAAPAAPTTTPTDEHNHFDECCICLYAMAPFQALFVSPCSHSYHYKCIRPLLSSYPGFQCPICRHYSDLEASVATEEEEEEKVILADKIRPVLTNATESTTVEASTSNEQQTTIDSGLALASPSHENIAEEDEEEEEEPSASMIIHDGPSSENISSSSSSGTDEDSEELPDVEEEEDEDPAPLPAHGDNPYSTTFVSSPIIYSEPLPEPALSGKFYLLFHPEQPLLSLFSYSFYSLKIL